MTKEQAAEKYSHSEYGVPNDCKPYAGLTEKQFDECIQEAHKAGWEAHEAQSIAHLTHPDHTIEPNWKEELEELRGRPDGDPYKIAIGKIYNMMQGVADDQLKGALCMAFLKQAIEPLVKTVSSTESYNLFNASEATSRREPICSCGGGDNNGHNWNCPWQEQEDEAPPTPQAVGPVWVKASNRLPKEPGRYFCRNIKTGRKSVNDFGLGKMSHLLMYPTELEWLDESNTQQVFTREDMEKAAGAYYMCGFPHQTTPKDWVNKNYPLSI